MFDNYINFDRLIIVRGYRLKKKIWEKVKELNEQVIEIDNLLATQYSNCVEGSLKSTQKREITKKRNELEEQKSKTANLYKQVKFWRKYALTFAEAEEYQLLKK